MSEKRPRYKPMNHNVLMPIPTNGDQFCEEDFIRWGEQMMAQKDEAAKKAAKENSPWRWLAKTTGKVALVAGLGAATAFAVNSTLGIPSEIDGKNHQMELAGDQSSPDRNVDTPTALALGATTALVVGGIRALAKG